MSKKFPVHLVTLGVIILAFSGLIYYILHTGKDYLTKLNLNSRKRESNSSGQSSLPVNRPLATSSAGSFAKDITSQQGVDFNIEVSRPNIGSTSSIQFEFSNEPNTEFIKSWEITIPQGFEFTNGQDISQGAVIGKALLDVIYNDKEQVAEENVLNDQSAQGHKANWSVSFFGSKFNTYVDGNNLEGYKITMERNFIEGLKQPSKLLVTIFANSPSQEGLIFTGPDSSGNYTFRARATLFDETTLDFQKTISIN